MDISDIAAIDPFEVYGGDFFDDLFGTRVEQVAGMKLELKKFDIRQNSKGEKTYLNTGKKFDFPKAKDQDNESALSVVKTYDEKNDVIKTETVVRSPYILEALRKVIVRYPDINLDADVVVISGPPRCLFHYYKELAAFGRGQHDETARKHILFALNYMKTTFSSDLPHYQNCMMNRSGDHGLDFDRLWMAFKPGDLIYIKENDEYFAGRLLSMICREGLFYHHWALKLEKIVRTGDGMKYLEETTIIRKYSGIKHFQDLEKYPLRYHPEKELIRQKLIARGASLYNLKGINQMYYRGNANWANDPPPEKVDWYDEGEYPFTKFHVRSRVMIDAEEFGDNRPNHNFTSTYTESKTCLLKANDRSEEQYLICHSEVFGYSLTDKRWCAFHLDRLQHVDYQQSAFEGLLLPTEQKNTIRSLVEVHTKGNVQFDDLVQDKGKGMIFLLHGEPGVGKTLTAESISDYVQRPLFILRSGDLGIEAQTLEKNLNEAFELAERWNAIILLDEADVFLEQRRRNELLRNSLVTVFLRTLEYYEGVMFLTTNRIETLDPAFKSRIHLSIKYHPLCKEFRHELWSNFINNGISEDIDLSARDPMLLDELANLHFNGRQIRNVVRTAYALALSAGEPMGESHIRMTLTALSAFDENGQKETNGWDTDDSETFATLDRRPPKRPRFD